VAAVSELVKPQEDAPRRDYDGRRGSGAQLPRTAGAAALPRTEKLQGLHPAWDGDDYPSSWRATPRRGEWILDGRSEALRREPFIRHFLDAQVVRMPSYRGHLEPQEVDRLVDYITGCAGPARRYCPMASFDPSAPARGGGLYGLPTTPEEAGWW